MHISPVFLTDNNTACGIPDNYGSLQLNVSGTASQGASYLPRFDIPTRMVLCYTVYSVMENLQKP